MTLANPTRLRAQAEALAMMLDVLGDRSTDAAEFFFQEEPLQRMPNTTWTELEAEGLIEYHFPPGHRGCRLTGLGWYKALEVTDRFSSPIFAARLSALTKVLKNSVKGRNDDAYLYTDKLAEASAVPEDFIRNAIESQLIDRRFRMRGAEWQDPGVLVRVPLDFGLRPLDCI